MAAARPVSSTPRGPAIDVSNIGGGRYRTCRQHPLWAPPSMSPTPVVARHRRLQHRWWPLPDMPSAPPRRPATDVFNFGDDRCRTCHQYPPGGPPSTSPTSGPTALTPLGGPPSTRFLALIVGAPGPLALAPLGNPPSTVG
jgi:hypothetical protein